MRIKAKIDDVEDWFIVDTGFSGDIMVNYEIFEKIPFPTFDAGLVCITENECYTAFGKISTFRILGNEINTVVLWIPQLDENLIGEAALIKLGLVINYKDFTILDP
ncbi:clan AA aspartic protease [Sulfurisphaera ohwakuensis]|uniref:clan AA aspartic protease n=1 Tax=Sulfurisphaera ohwakuensis TaxID=69656 RepID=UPI0036F4027F